MRIFYTTAFFFIGLFSFSQNFPYSQIDESLLKNANAVVRYDEFNIDLLSHDKMVVLARRVVTVLNEEGDAQVHAYQVYDKELRINELKAFVYDEHGKELEKLKTKDFLDQSATSGGTLYSDNRVKYLRYTPVSYPYTIEIIKEYETSDTAFIPTWTFLDDFELSTEKSIFSIRFTPGITHRVKQRNLEAFGVSLEETSNHLKFTALNIKAVNSEPYAPSFSEIAPSVSFAIDKFHLKGVDGYAKNWEQFGFWVYNSLLKGQDELDNATKHKIRQLVIGVSDKKEIVDRVYKYVQDNTRYISVQLGIGGWQPISAIEVDRVKYGDCKGLTNYTKALLKEVGVESYYTVIYGSTRKKDIDPDFPSLQGNHVVLNVPIEDKDVWLECTSQDTPVDYSAMFTDDRYALKITPNGGEIVKTKEYKDNENGQLTKADIFIDEQGSVLADVTIESTGTQYNQKYSLPSLTEQEQLNSYKEYWDYVNNIKIEAIKYENDRKGIRFTENVKIKTSDYVSLAGNNLLLAPNMFNRNLYVPKRIRNRKFDLVVSRGYLDEDEFIINLPKTVQIETLLNPVNISNEFGEYQIKMEKLDDNRIKYSRRLLIKANKFDKEKYKEFRDFRKKIAQNDNAKIVLIKP